MKSALELRLWLEYLQSDQVDYTDAERLDEILHIYATAKATVDAYQEVQDNLKEEIRAVLTSTGLTSIDVPMGNVKLTKASVSVSYDTKALDVLAESNDSIARLLLPHRKESQRAGTLRITLNK